MDEILREAWFLSGPTASGKSAVSLELARNLDAEILSLDSMAVFRGMDIGTAKPMPAERVEIAHHLIDIRDPHEEFSVVEYRNIALDTVAELAARGKRALFVGGTPLYLKAMLRGLFDGPPADWTLRGELAEEAARHGVETLRARLAAVDPQAAAKILPGDQRRIIRAIEVYEAVGRPLSELQQEFDRANDPLAVRVFTLQWPRATMHERIERRVVRMFEEGLIDETARLRDAPQGLGRTAKQAAGYYEALEVLEGRMTIAQAITRTQARTRQLAKRQETWFKSLVECRPIPMTPNEAPVATARRIYEQGMLRDV